MATRRVTLLCVSNVTKMDTLPRIVLKTTNLVIKIQTQRMKRMARVGLEPSPSMAPPPYPNMTNNGFGVTSVTCGI